MRKFALICTTLLLSALALNTSATKWLSNLSITNAQAPGKDGDFTATAANTIVNKYSRLTVNANAGDTIITIADVGGPDGLNPATLAPNDSLLIIQMQGASIDTSDSPSYGTVTNLNNAGRYEFLTVTSVSGNVVTLACGLRYNYTVSGKVQVIRVPQFANLTINPGASITAPAWNGTFGGVTAMQVQNNATINGAIDVSGRGFRGGQLSPNGLGLGSTLFRTTDIAAGGEKGEGIAGSQADYDSLGGRFGRGAPANGGGGGTAHNSGGGGGANGNNGNGYNGAGVMDPAAVGAAAWALDPDFIANGNALTTSAGGGRGGYGYSDPLEDQDALSLGPGNSAWGGDFRRNVGGRGGRPLQHDTSGRLFMGGGGGAGHQNNEDSGAGGNGGGLVIVIGGNVSGSGVIHANGTNGGDSIDQHRDPAGGAGGGGTIIVDADTLAGVSLQTIGGNGGNHGKPIGQFTNEGHGTGGGGGGGLIATAGGAAPVNVNGGANGVSLASTLTEFPANGGTRGATGIAGPAVNIPLACLPPTSPTPTPTVTPPPGTTVSLRTRVSPDDICVGANKFLAVESVVSNLGPGIQGDNPGPEYRAELPVRLEPVANSCQAVESGTVTPIGTCTIVGNQFHWNGVLNPGQSITIKFRTKVKTGVNIGDSLCIVTKVHFDSDGDGTNDKTTTVNNCVTVNCEPPPPCTEPNCPPTGPGEPLPPAGAPSDQRPGSVLVFPIYTSDLLRAGQINTRFNITNTSTSSPANVHLFFIDGSNCSVSDRYVCLTQNQTVSLLASDLDPGVTGYLVAVATDSYGCPIRFNFLIGDEYVKTELEGHRFFGSVGAEAFSALRDIPCDPLSPRTAINFDGVDYDLAPRALALSNIGSSRDGNFTWLIVDSLGGDLTIRTSPIGAIFGNLYDDDENPASFDLFGGCQLRGILSDSFPRTAPRFSQKIPAGRTGWMKFWTTAPRGILGVSFNANGQATGSIGAFNGAHMLHKLTLTQDQYIMPVFPPSC